MDYALFRLINDLAGHVAWVDRSAVVSAEYLSGLFSPSDRRGLAG